MRALLTTAIAITLTLFLTALSPGCEQAATDAPTELAAAAEQPPTDRVGDETPRQTPETPAPTDNTEPTAPPRSPIAAPVDAIHGGLGSPDQAGLEPVNADAFVRSRRRMDIGQLSDAIERVTGGIGWVDNKDADRWEQLAATLGRPDYIISVTEDLGAGPVFQKFLGDAARDVCTKLANSELANSELANSELANSELDTEPADRVLMKHASPTDTLLSAPDAVEANLRMLLLRYHGVKAEAGAADLVRWRWLFESVSHVTKLPVEGWRAVCIGLIEHPDFYSY
jgi:hypothetical protein